LAVVRHVNQDPDKKLAIQLFALSITAFGLPVVAAVAVFFGPTPCLSAADIPLCFYAGAGVTLLDTLEDGSLDASLTGSGGSVLDVSFARLRDSVDADGGLIDGTCGPQTPGRCVSWFNRAGSSGATPPPSPAKARCHGLRPGVD